MKLITRKEKSLRRTVDSLRESLSAAKQQIKELERENASLKERIANVDFIRAEGALKRLKEDYNEGIQASWKAKETYKHMCQDFIVMKRKYQKDMDAFFSDLRQKS